MGKNMVLKCLSPFVMAEKAAKETERMLEETLGKGLFPYNRFPPQAENMDVISGHSLKSIQSVQMDVEAAMANTESRNWIFGTHAELLGLKMKPETKLQPVILYGLKDGEVVAQMAYPIDCFTEQSVIQAMSLSKESSDPLVTALSQNLSLRLSGNGTTPEDISKRTVMRENAGRALNSSSSVHGKVLDAYKSITSTMSADEKKAFDTVYKYYAVRNGVVRKAPDSGQVVNDGAFKNLVETKGRGRLMRLILKAQAFAEQLTHWNFEHEPVYTSEQAAVKEKLTWKLPEASKDFYHEKEVAKAAITIQRERTSPQHTIVRHRKPSIGHSR